MLHWLGYDIDWFWGSLPWATLLVIALWVRRDMKQNNRDEAE